MTQEKTMQTTTMMKKRMRKTREIREFPGIMMEMEMWTSKRKRTRQ